MNTDPQKHSNAAHHSYAVGTVTFKMVREFARELAQEWWAALLCFCGSVFMGC